MRLEFSLFSEYGVIEAKMKMKFTDKCTMTLTHLGQEPAQAALHSYFNIGDISQIEVQNLPSRCYDSLQGKHIDVPSTRRIEQGVDCIYTLEEDKTFLVDKHLIDVFKLPIIMPIQLCYGILGKNAKCNESRWISKYGVY